MTMRRILLSLALLCATRNMLAGVVVPTADLAITKTGSAGSANPGASFVYTITVTNNGPDPVQTQVSDALPTNATLLVTDAPAYSCSGVAVGATGVLTCTRPTLMPAATTDTITLTVIVNPTATDILTNNASVAPVTGVDPNSTNNNAFVLTPIVAAGTDVGVTKTAGTGPFTAGGNVSFTITVGNAGPIAATNVTVTDALPPGSSFVSASPTQGTCAPSPGTVICSLGTMNALATATIPIVIQSPSTPGLITNTANVSATEPDVDITNNSSSASVTTVAPGPPSGIPTMSTWMLALLASALALVALKR
jgi:uncharacterized repeat protein (TIGR01451 family)